MESNKKLVAITGANSGIGFATASLLSEKGYPLLLLDILLDKIEKFPNTLCVKCDVTDYA